jgi:hypothetical protein
MKRQAIRSYRRYLDLVPRADDAQKVRNKIEKLQKEVEKERKWAAACFPAEHLKSI